MGNVHNYEEIKDLLFGKGRSRPLHPEDGDLDEIISKVLQKVEIEAVRRDRLANAKFYKEQVGKIFDKEVQIYEATLRNQTGANSDE